MIICKKCKRQTAPGEATGKINIVESLSQKGKRIVSSEIVCTSCSREEMK